MAIDMEKNAAPGETKSVMILVKCQIAALEKIQQCFGLVVKWCEREKQQARRQKQSRMAATKHPCRKKAHSSKNCDISSA